MDPPLFVVKGSLFNALFPTYLSTACWAALILFPLAGGAYALAHFGTIDVPTPLILSTYLVLVLFGALIPLVWRIIVILCTTYAFYHDRVVMEYRFFTLKQVSVPYAKITNITVDISFWDRVSAGGNITLHTADDQEPNLVLYNVSRPAELHERIYSLVRSSLDLEHHAPVSHSAPVRVSPSHADPSATAPHAAHHAARRQPRARNH
jgi:uncharacterized membrane protein YdbT with pleckstrin-like domain